MHLKTSKLTKLRNVWPSGRRVRTASGCHTLRFSNGCILLTIGSIYTKLGDFVKLGLHFMTMWIQPEILSSDYCISSFLIG